MTTPLHLRSEWALRVLTNPAPVKNVATVFLHHEGGPVRGNPANKPQVLRGIESAVMNKGYVAIDYNLMVFQDGSVWEGRGLGHEDAATLGWNAKSVSICAVGNFQIEDPTPDLLNGVAEAVRLARAGQWATPDCTLLGHRDAGTFATACPGDRLQAQLPKIRDLLINPAPTTPPEDDMEHGMAVDLTINPSNPAQGYVLDRWGGVHAFGGAKAVTSGPYWKGLDVARRVIVTDWTAGKGYVLDLRGAAHPFGGAPALATGVYWSSGALVPFGEL